MLIYNNVAIILAVFVLFFIVSYIIFIYVPLYCFYFRRFIALAQRVIKIN